jgi:hypothetical protein
MKLKFLPPEQMPEGTPLSEATLLWRYMRFSTFLWLLQGHAFIPLVKQLQASDPKEGYISRYDDEVLETDQFDEARLWLSEGYASRHPDLHRFLPNGLLHDPVLLDEWRHQLGARRAAWCWFARFQVHDGATESMAMWDRYAKEGIAIKTTLGQATSSLCLGAPDLGEILVVEINYRELPPCSPLRNDYAMRPFALKSPSYEHEKEVRLVFRVNAAVGAPGVKVRLDPKRLLDGQEVIISPYLERDEAKAVQRLGKEMLNGTNVGFRQSSERSKGDSDPSAGMERDDAARLDIISPFSKEEGLPGLLQDL